MGAPFVVIRSDKHYGETAGKTRTQCDFHSFSGHFRTLFSPKPSKQGFTALLMRRIGKMQRQTIRSRP